MLVVIRRRLICSVEALQKFQFCLRTPPAPSGTVSPLRGGGPCGGREFITLLGGAAAWPSMARAQQPTMPTIGFLGGSSPAVDGHRVAVFVQRLRELGWIEGRTVAIDVQWAQGRAERFAETLPNSSGQRSMSLPRLGL